MKKIALVYYGVLVNDWEEHMVRHIERTVKSGLYDAADLFYVTVVDFAEQKAKLESVLSKYPKIVLEYHTEITPDNPDRSLRFGGEYWGVKKIDELGKANDNMCLLYFNSKGVVNKWKNFNTKEYSEKRVQCVADWTNCMAYFLVERWRECIDKMDKEGYDTVGVTNVNRWWWGNFWWATSEHVKKNVDFPVRDRWYSEAWCHEGRIDGDTNSIKYYEWWHWVFDAFYTEQPRWLYDGSYRSKGKKLIIHKAQYGYQTHQRDEAYDYMEENLVDVTDQIRKIVEENNGELKFHANEYTLGIPEVPTNHKRVIEALFVSYSFEDRPNDILTYGTIDNNANLPIPEPAYMSA